jgi:hypothetical protein
LELIGAGASFIDLELTRRSRPLIDLELAAGSGVSIELVLVRATTSIIDLKLIRPSSAIVHHELLRACRPIVDLEGIGGHASTTLVDIPGLRIELLLSGPSTQVHELRLLQILFLRRGGLAHLCWTHEII